MSERARIENEEKHSTMASNRILYVCQEVAPYVPDTEGALLCRKLSQAMQERGNEIRTFMPRYGCINERRHQLHEVIRLSGMNLIIDDNDHQLIIKVASIPSARVQIYFIDNDDYFARKAILRDADESYFEDNDERAIFFARGVLETVKKLRWTPTVVHCHDWFSGIVPIYLKKVFADDPIFKEVKIVISLYGDGFDNPLNAKWESFGWHVIEIDGHNMEQILTALDAADQINGKPTVIIANTVKGKGVSFAENVVGCHNCALTEEQYAQALRELQ